MLHLHNCIYFADLGILKKDAVFCFVFLDKLHVT